MRENSCSKIKSNLCAYLDKELSLKESSLIDKHLQVCVSCQKDLSVLKSLQNKLNTLAQVSLPKEPPNNLAEKIISGLPKYNLGIFTDPLMRNAAIGITITLILFMGGLKFFQKPYAKVSPKNLVFQAEAAPKIIETKDQNQKIIFSDGSAIFLKGDANLEIKKVSPDVELILNKGAVLFSVIKSPLERNFIIQTPLVRIQVLGTLFKVSVDKKHAEIIVLEGEVQLKDNSGNESLGSVKPFEKAVVTAGWDLSLAINKLSEEEINNLKREFALAHLIKRDPVPANPSIIWWREIKE